MGAARKYPDELRDRAVRLVLDLVKDQEASVTAACRKVGGELGIKADTLRGWAKRARQNKLGFRLRRAYRLWYGGRRPGRGARRGAGGPAVRAVAAAPG